MTHAAVRVDLAERSYDVHVGDGATEAVAARAGQHRHVALLADRRVAEHHAAPLVDRLIAAGADVLRVDLPEGESAKSMHHVEAACRGLVSAGIERGDCVVGLGGGAATDVAGFVAATLLRGLPWYALPTSLLGMVDAAVGGKTGVNLPEGKNLVGAFHQPGAVACDPAYLATLEPREFRAGLAEVVKTAWLGDPELFVMMEQDPPTDAAHPALAGIVRRCVAVKADVVSRDEREGGLRAKLNFGHTLGHAMETAGEGRWLHGEAVSLGMVAAVHISVETGRCERPELDRLMALLETLGLPTRWPGLDADRVWGLTAVDKKRADGALSWQLTRGLGFVSVARDLPEQAPRASLEFLRR